MGSTSSVTALTRYLNQYKNVLIMGTLLSLLKQKLSEAEITY